MKTLSALGDTVIVEAPDQKEKKTAGGLVLPQSNDKESRNQGVVVSVGDTVKGISVGDTVIISRTGIGEVFVFNDKYCIAMPKAEVYAVIKEVETNA